MASRYDGSTPVSSYQDDHVLRLPPVDLCGPECECKTCEIERRRRWLLEKGIRTYEERHRIPGDVYDGTVPLPNVSDRECSIGRLPSHGEGCGCTTCERVRKRRAYLKNRTDGTRTLLGIFPPKGYTDCEILNMHRYSLYKPNCNCTSCDLEARRMWLIVSVLEPARRRHHSWSLNRPLPREETPEGQKPESDSENEETSNRRDQDMSSKSITMKPSDLADSYQAGRQMIQDDAKSMAESWVPLVEERLKSIAREGMLGHWVWLNRRDIRTPLMSKERRIAFDQLVKQLRRQGFKAKVVDDKLHPNANRRDHNHYYDIKVKLPRRKVLPSGLGNGIKVALSVTKWPLLLGAGYAAAVLFG